VQPTEDDVKNAAKMLVLAMLVFVGSGLMLSGCKSAPELTKANALALIQAKYDQTPVASAEITIDLNGLARGVTANYWARTKLYPNKYWADFTLTPVGKKVIKLPKGGDVLQWRPENAGDKNFTMVIETVAANHLKASDAGDPQDEIGGTKSVSYLENISLDGAPKDVQIMADGPGNKLSSKHIAIFTVDAGAWKLQSIN
jgi:hypothetical protein